VGITRLTLAMKLRLAPSLSLALAVACTLGTSQAATKKPEAKANTAKAATPQGWFSWRGPSQNGTSLETGLPDKVDAAKPLWAVDFPGQSAPVIANGKVYINGYVGDGPDLREGVSCFDADTGKVLWQNLQDDFLSDTIYLRYATGAPVIDPETGNVFVQGGQGLLSCFTSDGKLVWQHSLMEEYGRMTFPNARTATPVVDQDLVLTRGSRPVGARMAPPATASSPSIKRPAISFGSPRPPIALRTTRSLHFSSTGTITSACSTRRAAIPPWCV
jgi:hypothetical protein